MSKARTTSARALTVIDGIGDKVAAHLASHGVTTTAELAMRSPDDLASILRDLRGGFTAQRIRSARWCEQAAALVDPVVAPTRHNFTVEATVDAATGRVVASQIDHVQSGDRRSWFQWDGDGVVEFMHERIGPEALRPASVAAAERPSGSGRSTLHAYALVPQPGLQCDRRGNVRARLTFSPKLATLGDDADARAVIRLFVSGRPGAKADLIGTTDQVILPDRETVLDVAGVIPAGGEGGSLFALVEIHGSPAGQSPVRDIPGARLALVE